MSKRFKIAAVTAAMLAMSPVLASDLAEIQATKDASVSLVQAIQAAEKEHNGGRAMQAEIEAKRRSDRAEVFYEVKVLAGDGKVFDVIVDAKTGRVISSREDIYD